MTVKNYKADISQFIKWFEKEFGAPFDPSKISLQTWEEYKKTRTLSATSLERHKSSLRKFFNFLKSHSIIDFELFPNTVYEEKIKADPWKIKNFKSFLYDNKKSNLTIKNYIS